MVITFDDICEEKDRILSKHPNLKRLTVKSLNEYPISNQELGEFIEGVWTKDYPGEARVVFTPDFLDYNEPEMDKDCTIVALFNNQLIGCFLSYQKKFSNISKQRVYSHNTGLTVNKEHVTEFAKRGKGIGQLLWIEQMKLAYEKEYSGTTYWIDIRHNQPGSSSRTFCDNRVTAEQNRPVPILGKSFSFKKASYYGRLNLIQRIGVKAIDKAIRLTDLAFGNNKTEMEIDHDYLAASKFLQALDGNLYAPSLDEETMRTKAIFTSETLNSLLLNFKMDGDTIGVMYGFTTPVGGDNYFQIDGFYFKEGLDWKTKRAMTKFAEEKIQERYNSFSCVIPANCTNESMLKFGYIEVENQNLIINHFKECDDCDFTTELR